MSPETHSSLAAILLSLIFSYVPSLAPKYDALDPTCKRLVMLACLIVIAAASVALACTGLATDIGLPLVCTRSGIVALLNSLFLALVANQTT